MGDKESGEIAQEREVCLDIFCQIFFLKRSRHIRPERTSLLTFLSFSKLWRFLSLRSRTAAIFCFEGNSKKSFEDKSRDDSTRWERKIWSRFFLPRFRGIRRRCQKRQLESGIRMRERKWEICNGNQADEGKTSSSSVLNWCSHDLAATVIHFPHWIWQVPRLTCILLPSFLISHNLCPFCNSSHLHFARERREEDLSSLSPAAGWENWGTNVWSCQNFGGAKRDVFVFSPRIRKKKVCGWCNCRENKQIARSWDGIVRIPCLNSFFPLPFFTKDAMNTKMQWIYDP